MEKIPTPPSENQQEKANFLAVELAKQFESDAYTLLSKVPPESRKDVAEALADFSEQFNTFQNPGHQLSTEEAVERACELTAKLRSFTI
jgi:DNA polymerase IIIc chi subunit